MLRKSFSSKSFVFPSFEKCKSMTNLTRFSRITKHLHIIQNPDIREHITTSNQHILLKQFFYDVGHKLGVQNLDDWYHKISVDVITKYGEHKHIAMNKFTKSTIITALMTAFPEHDWNPWKFSTVPKGYWNNKLNHRKYFDWLAKELGVHEMDDWYKKLSRKSILQNRGGGLLEIYNGSPITALMTVYPDHNWIVWKFNCTPMGFWNSKQNQRNYFDWLATMAGVTVLDDWYEKLSVKLLHYHGGGRLLALHNNSPTAALMSAYPQHNWIVWKFKNVASSVWNSSHNVQQYLNELSEKLLIQTFDDWYRVERPQLMQLGASPLLQKYKGLYGLLMKHYPHYPWDQKKFHQLGKKAQRSLLVALRKMFPDEEILEDYIHPSTLLPSSKRPLQFDIFIPSRFLAFEYQGEQHYQNVGIFSSFHTYQFRDQEKRQLCLENKITLIEVPYWWNRSQKSLQEIICENQSVN